MKMSCWQLTYGSKGRKRDLDWNSVSEGIVYMQMCFEAIRMELFALGGTLE